MRYSAGKAPVAPKERKGRVKAPTKAEMAQELETLKAQLAQLQAFGSPAAYYQAQADQARAQAEKAAQDAAQAKRLGGEA